MDESTFDRLAKSVGLGSSRRRLLAMLTGLSLGGALAVLETDDAGAEKPKDRLQRRTKQRRRKRRNEKRRNQNQNPGGNGGNSGGGGLGSIQCGATDDDCTQASDCCSNNCLNLGCADKVRKCGSTTCHPTANACAGETCCYGQAVCNGTCCDAPANQCNPQGECCAPNCAGRQCGTDGCGGGGTCGSCPGGATCNESTGQCVNSCQATYGASACETPTTVCGDNIVTCGGNPNCWAMPTTSGCCACSSVPGRSHQTCTSTQDCLGAARCMAGRCNGDPGLACTTDGDCASLLTCRDGECGGPICTTDADCERVVGPDTVCISGAKLPCTAGGANICWTLCPGA